MHLSLYRKFRPDSFEKMVRQEHVVRVLKNQIGSGEISHAYLFTGPRGTGKTTVARIFARAVNCEHPKDGSPCGECPCCKALKEGSLDIAEIDAASNNGVNEMRDLREKVQYPPVTGKYKVYIVDEVHMLTDSAFNALLKTLEEPPAHAIFILATTEPHKIPATILSRCMRLDFKLIPEEDLEKHLMGILDEIGKPYEREAVAAIARAGAGSDRDMLSIAEMCISYSDKLTYEGVTAVLGAADFTETCSLCSAFLSQDLPATLEKAEKILAEGKSVGVLCRDLLEMLNRIAVVKTCRTAEKLLSLPHSHYERVASVAAAADGRAILRATEILARTETDLRFVSSPRVCLETALMKIAIPSADESSDALFVRIAALEEKLSKGTVVPSEPPKPQTPQKNASAQEEPVPERRAEPDLPKREPVVFKPAVREESAPSPFPEAPVKPAEAPKETKPSNITAELAYGKFMRTLRKTSRNGVLFTMCSDLEAAFEGDKLVLSTGSETVMRSLSREEHRAIMENVFREIGIPDFEIRLKGQEPSSEKDALAQLRNDFGDYPIEIK